MSNLLQPNEALIRQHLGFLFSKMSEYADGRIEIAYGDKNNAPNQAATFTAQEADAAVALAVEKNSQGRNVYVVGSLIDPDCAPFGRSSDSDFYASSVIWCDIDTPVNPAELREKYAKLPPSLIVVTGRHPHVRTHLWWKLDEAITDADTLREALEGVQQHMGGDRAVKNVTSLMRLGGSIAWAKKSGRVDEMTEVIVPSNASTITTIDAMLMAYPSGEFQHTGVIVPHKATTTIGSNPFEERIEDGREQYMHEMLCAAIVNLTAAAGRWPTAQEVFDDAWPVYERKVTGRGGKTLDQEGRGQKLMQNKIASKLSAFTRGKVRGLESVQIIVNKNSKAAPMQAQPAPEVKTIANENGEVLEDTQTDTGLLPIKWAYDVTARADANDFVEGFLGNGQFSIIYGESNCGKTFFATDLAFHIAMGKRWRNRRVDQGGVVYIALEGSFGLENRIAAFMKEYPEESRGMPFAFITTQINFLDPIGKLPSLVNTINNVSQQIGGVKLVVVDTLARAISGGDENSGQDMGLLVTHADMIRAATGAHVCFVHHSGKDRLKGARGHSSLRAAVDTEVEVSRFDGADYSTVKTVKQRDMEMGEEMFFGLKSVSIAVNRHNEEVKSCVVTVIDEPEASRKNTNENLTPTQQFVYDAIVNALIDSGEMRVPAAGMAQVKCISYEQLRSRLEVMGFRELVDETKAKNITSNTRIALRDKNKIGFNAGYIWLLNAD